MFCSVIIYSYICSVKLINKTYFIMKKKSRLTAHRIASIEWIMQAFRGEPVIFTAQVADERIGKCIIRQLIEREDGV